MKKFIISLLLIFASAGQLLFAQSLFLEWQTCLGGSSDDYGNSMKLVVGNQGLGIVGRTTSNDGNLGCGFQGNTDAFYATTDTFGSNLYYRCFGGTGYDEFNSFIEYVPGFYYKYIIGRTSSNDGDVSGNHGSFDAWLLKTTFGGQIMWQKCIGGTGWEDGFSIVPTSDGNLLMAGITSSDTIDGQATACHGAFDGWLVKMDTSGNVLWQKCFGGSNSEFFYSVIESSDGNYVVGGFSDSDDGDLSTNLGSTDYWLLKVDTGGQLLWQKTFGGTGGDEAYSVIETIDNNLMIVGYSYSQDNDAILTKADPGSSNILMIKIDQLGNKLWSNCYGDIGGARSKSVLQEANGNYRLGCSVSSATGDASGCNIHGCCDAWMLTLDSTGAILNNQCFGSSSVDDGIKGIVASLEHGHYYFLGQAGNNSGDVTGSHGFDEIWIVKYIDSTSIINKLNELKNNDFIVFPNPFNTQIIVSSLSTTLNTNVQIIDLLGRKHYCPYIKQDDHFIIDSSELNEGIYFVQIFSGTSFINHKLIKLKNASN